MKRSVTLARKRKQRRSNIWTEEAEFNCGMRFGSNDRPSLIAAVRQRRYDVPLDTSTSPYDIASIAFDYQDEFTDDELQEILQFLVDNYGEEHQLPGGLYFWVQSTRWLSILHSRIHLPYINYAGTCFVAIAAREQNWSSVRYLIFQVGAPFNPNEVLDYLLNFYPDGSRVCTARSTLACFEMIVTEVAAQKLSFGWSNYLVSACSYSSAEWTLALLNCLLRNHTFTSKELGRALIVAVNRKETDLRVLVKLLQAGAILNYEDKENKWKWWTWPASVYRILARYHADRYWPDSEAKRKLSLIRNPNALNPRFR